MDTEKAREEIDYLFGEDWFDTVLEPKFFEMFSLEQQVELAKNWSVPGKTFFFRDDLVNAVLDNIVIPSFANNHYKIASIGCSDGREVYSFLIKNWHNRNNFEISGFDSNLDSIETAKNGQGKTYATKDYEIRDWEAFGAKDKAYTIKDTRDYDWKSVIMTDEAKKHVSFNFHNIADSPLQKKYDVIILKNVLYYYTPEGREKILNNVNKSMVDGAWLLCESFDSCRYEEYHTFMKDISSLGFVKQTTVVPWWHNPADDMSSFSKVYRKITKQ